MADSHQPELKQLPFASLHERLGGRMVPFAGYAMPVQYADGVMAEHRWTRAHAGLFDVSHMGQIDISGAGADVALEALMPGDFTGLRENALRYSMLLDDAGGIIDDLMVTRRSGDFYLVVNGANKLDDIAHLRARLPDAVRLVHRTDLALLALQGPDAEAVLEALVPGVSALKFMRAGSFSWNGVPLWISRSGYTGEDGYEISLPVAAVAFAEALLADARVKPAGLGARDSLRLEAGLPLHGHDLDRTTTPVEAGLAFAISKRRKAEGGFPGAPRVLGQLLDGPARRRVGLKPEGRQPVREGAPIFAGDSEVGRVTSGGFGPSVEAPVAMGYVAAAHAGDGTALEIEVRGRRIAATVVPMPFWQKNYAR